MDDEVDGIDYLPPFGTHRKSFQGKVTFQGSGTQSAFFLSQFPDSAGLGKMRHISVFFLPQFQGFVQQFLSLINISEPTRQAEISYSVFCL